VEKGDLEAARLSVDAVIKADATFYPLPTAWWTLDSPACKLAGLDRCVACAL